MRSQQQEMDLDTIKIILTVISGVCWTIVYIEWTTLVLISAGLVQIAFVRQFQPSLGAAYAAFLQNLLMSVLFINMLVQRGTSEGQSQIIAISKWLGTLTPTILLA